MSNYFDGKRVTVTGGAALIGSHLTEALLERGADVVVADDMSAGKLENVPDGVTVLQYDLRDYSDALDAVVDADVVFHLACQHGGRGYVDTHPVESYDNMALDATVFRACANTGKTTKRVVFASSACAYPVDLQNSDDSRPLVESDIDYKHPRNPDGAYGWSKLAGELTLNAYTVAGDINGISARQFTVYGPRMGETHAICALIAKTFIKQEPFEIWGTGEQLRNWTYVEDTVNGLMLLAENTHLHNAHNLGVEQRYTVHQACEIIWKIMGWKPKEIIHRTMKLTGPYNRIADASKIRKLGWKPSVSLEQGIENTIRWYTDENDVETVKRELEHRLTERK